MNLSFFLLLLNLTDLVAHRAVSDTFSVKAEMCLLWPLMHMRTSYRLLLE